MARRAACVSLPVRCDSDMRRLCMQNRSTGGLTPNGTRFHIVDLTLRVRQAAKRGLWHSSLRE